MTAPQPPLSSPAPDAEPALNALAAAYQPRRVQAAVVSIAWNLSLAGVFVFSGAAEHLWLVLSATLHPALRPITIAAYLVICFGGYALFNYPLDLWYGYLQDRQFGLVKDGIRAWTREWLIGLSQQGGMFFLGSLSLITLQAALPSTWLVASSGLVLIVFLLTSYYAAALVPAGLIEREPADAETIARLRGLITPAPADRPDLPALPPVVIYSAPSQRDYSGGVLGLAGRQVLLISRATIELASDRVLRFVLLHELGHRRYHHILLATLAGWAWTCIGLVVADRLIPAHALATPVYIAHLALWFSIWMAFGEPLLSYLSRRLEYQADRFYLRHGTLAEMRAALSELSQRNLARTDALPRRQSLVQPLPTVANRLRRAARYRSQPAPEPPTVY